ncbi:MULTISPECIES: MOSC N-terminal beta barrel domain-containing protein [Ramlibacter]|uniref:MOSC N-terminal beta barrel domain-containing protein n=1 Tax=Ramlibacter aquaticus TaxID=2780094 RepID=A0ABR9SCH4_9BURK|nr:MULTISPECIES: MOSC N-terminal beta barrel domain-containing protein [Ramlibacter]MBE7939467.1 MOSC N-terminal beta barrel domain-containing protein [Ramlibacter aquaticus]
MSPDVSTRIARLFCYPVKSCAGVELAQADLAETGLDLDRAWMVVDEDGEFVSQRELPRMALVRPQIKLSEVVLRAPGMLALHLAVDTVESPRRVRVWDDEVDAWDMGDLAAQWFSDFLGQRLRLVRFDPEVRRLSSRQWTGTLEAPNQFSDGFPLLVVSEGSLAELNRRLAEAGHAAVGMERFRPNIVLAGLEAQDEDRLGALRILTGDAEVLLRPVKPCPRCPMPDIDPATGVPSPEVGDTLRRYRANERVGDAVSFGMNAVIVAGVGQRLAVGQAVEAGWQFD